MEYMDQRERILVVDDDRHVREVLSAYLGGEGYTVSCAPDAETALSLVRRVAPDVILLDIRLPGKSGLETLSQLRAAGSRASVIILTACAEEVDKVLGLELGADDYVTKPFSSREILARIRSITRRSKAPEPAVVKLGPIEIDPAGYEVRLEGKVVPLTRTEFRIVELLARHPGRTFERGQLLDSIAADHDVLDRTLDKHVMNIRRKFSGCPAAADAIVTVHGVGYKLVVPEPAPAQPT